MGLEDHMDLIKRLCLLIATFPARYWNRDLIKTFRVKFGFEWPILLYRSLGKSVIEECYENCQDFLEDFEKEIFEYFVLGVMPRNKRALAMLYAYYLIDLPSEEILSLLICHEKVKYRVVEEKPELLKGRLWKLLTFEDVKRMVKYGGFITAECILWAVLKYLSKELSKKEFKEILNSNLPLDVKILIKAVNSGKINKIVKALKELNIIKLTKNVLKEISANKYLKISKAAQMIIKYEKA